MNTLNTTRNEFVLPEPFTFRYNAHEVARIAKEAEHLRAETVARQLAIVGRAVGRAVTWTVGAVFDFFALLARAKAASETYDALSRLSDRQLEDIGLTRDGIGARVVKILGGGKDEPKTAAELYAVKGGKSAKPRTKAPSRRAA